MVSASPGAPPGRLVVLFGHEQGRPLDRPVRERVALGLDREQRRRLIRLAEDRGVGVTAVVRAGLAALLTRLGAGTDVPIGVPVADPSRDGGFTVATLVVNTDTASLGELVHRGGKTAPATGRRTSIHSGRDEHDLFLGLVEPPDTEGIDSTVDLFSRTTTEEVAGRLVRLLDAATRDPDRIVADIDVLTETERRRLLPGDDVAGPGLSITDAFARQVAVAPEAIAVVCGDVELSYAELDRRSNQVAHQLIAMGLPPESRVGILRRRSPELVVSVLGVLKAGAAYVPLDERYPQARRQLILEDSGCAALLTDEDPPPAGSCAAVDRAVRPDRLAYVMFTSGSTGRPKGVAVTHDNVVRLALDECFDRANHRRVLVHSPFGFDGSTYELWVTLLTGGRLVLVDGHDADLAHLSRVIARDGVTAAYFTAGLFALMAEAHLDALALLREVWTGGDVVSPATLRRVLDHCPDTVVVHSYGPTETTFASTWQRFGPADRTVHSIHLGRPLTHNRLYVLDERLNLVPPGVPGELYIAGGQVARGYLGRPGLTAQRFVADPFGAGGRMYRTGDLVVWTPAHELRFLGRVDDQVKLHGFRVEPGEIEAVLVALPDVANAAVAVREDRPGRARLVAYLVATGPDVDLAAARTAVTDTLPRYMVPSDWVVLDALPLTPHGKLDRAALPAPAAAPSDEGADEGADTLRALWIEATNDRDAASGRGFHAAGGDSIGAALLARRVLEQLGKGLPISWLLVDDVSLDVLRRRLEQPGHQAGPAATGAPGRPHPAQRRLWLLEQVYGSLAPYNVVSGIELTGGPDPAAIRAAVASAIRRHPALRTRICAGPDGDPVLHVDDAVAPPFSVLDTPGAGDHPTEVERLLDRLQWTDYPIDRSPAFEVVALPHPDGRRMTIVFAGNHLICDQQSTNTFWREVIGGLPDAGQVVPAPALSDDARAAADLRFWLTELSGSPVSFRLPFARARSDVPSFRAHLAKHVLPHDHAERFTAACRGMGLRPAFVLLTAFACVLGSWSGDREITVGMPLDVRSTSAQALAIGFATQSLPVVVPADTGAPLARLASRAQANHARGAEHAAVNLDELVRALGLSGDIRHNPLFQVWFNDMSATEQLPRSTDGAPVRAVRVPHPPALFDVGLHNHRTADGSWELHLTVAEDLFDDWVPGALLHALVQVVAGFAGDPAHAEAGTSLPRGVLGSPPDRPVIFSPGDLARRFLAHAEADGDRPAITGSGQTWTYGLLADRAAALAAGLGRHAGTDRPLVVMARRSPWLAATVLAGWFSGLPLVLLDARLPDTVTADLLRACAPHGTVVAEDEDRVAGAYPAARILDLASPADRPRPPVPRPPGRISHLLTTSGTSGNPRVVAVPGTAFATALMAEADAMGLTADDRFCLLAGPGHDPVFRDLLLPLVLGATTWIPEPGTLSDPTALLRGLRAEATTVLHLTPTRAALVAAAASSLDMTLPDVRLVVLGGEALSVLTADRVQALCPNAVVCNGFGSTEIPQLSSVHRWRGPAHGQTGTVPLGRGFAGRELVVVRGDGLAGAGQRGEIAVIERRCEAGSAADHLPATALPGGLVAWRTGDLGRVDPDGNVWWCGRGDRLLSVDGYRVDPEAVENVLTGMPGIGQACVALDEDGMLTAYVVGWCAGLRDALLARLPRWSVPERIHQVSAIALSRNGKVDPAATARLRVGGPREHGTTAAEPGHRTVETIVRNYVADASALTAERNFFDAGLDSFTMLRLHRELRQAGFPDLDLVDLFRWPTIRALSARLARGGQAGPRDAGVMAGIGAALPRAERRRQARASIKALSAEME